MQYVLILAEITDFDADGPVNGLSYSNGVLRVLHSGTYYIYAQAFFEAYHGAQRLELVVSGKVVSVIQNPPGTGSQYGNRFTAVIKELTTGDYICLRSNDYTKLWMEKAYTFFGTMSI